MQAACKNKKTKSQFQKLENSGIIKGAESITVSWPLASESF